MTLDDILLEAEEKMLKTEQAVVKEFAGVRTGRASTGLVENITGSLWVANADSRIGKHHHPGTPHAGDPAVGYYVDSGH